MQYGNLTVPSKGVKYQDYGNISTDGGATWTAEPATFFSGSIKNDWEPENVAYGNTAFLTFHSLSNQGIYVDGTTTAGSTWSAPFLLSPTSLSSAYSHIFTSDGVNVFVMWGQQIKSGSSTWNAYMAFSGNSGGTWSMPIDISNNANGVAAANKDVTTFSLSSSGTACYAAWTYTSGASSQVYFASS